MRWAKGCGKKIRSRAFVTGNGRRFFAQPIGLLDHGIGTILAVRTIEGVQLRPKRASAERPQRVALVAWIREGLQERVYEFRMGERLWVAGPIVRGPIQLLPIAGFQIDWPLMEPGLGEEGRREMLFGYCLEACRRAMAHLRR